MLTLLLSRLKDDWRTHKDEERLLPSSRHREIVPTINYLFPLPSVVEACVEEV